MNVNFPHAKSDLCKRELQRADTHFVKRRRQFYFAGAYRGRTYADEPLRRPKQDTNALKLAPISGIVIEISHASSD